MSEGNMVWNCRDIAANASNWSLSCDVNLLKFLEVFSDQMLESCEKTNDGLEKLSKRLGETSSSLNLARNEFSSLSNTQFIESRIYEEDETVNEEKIDETDKTNDENTKSDLREAALRGLAVIEKYYEKVDVPESDSEDENLPNFVLRAKDPYIQRPLPFVIGSREWYKSTNAGIADSSSESEAEAVSEKYSDSEEGEIPENKMNTESETSEGELSNQPVANSTFNKEIDKNEDLDNGDRYNNTTNVQISISQKLFAEQLAQKLGNVINANETAEVNTRPIQQQQHNDYGKLISNEPPPIDNANIFDNKSSNLLFSGGESLFDDLEDDVSFWGKESTSKKEVLNPNILNKKTNDLFDTNVLSDDDLFSTKSILNKSEGVLKKPTVIETKKLSLFDDDSELEEDDEMFTKEPVKPSNKSLSFLDDDSNDSDNFDELFSTKSQEPKKIKEENLFDVQDTEDKFNNNNKSSKPIVDKIPSLFSDVEDSDSDDLFSLDKSKPKINLENPPEENLSFVFKTENTLENTVIKENLNKEISKETEKKEEENFFFEDIPSTKDIFDDISPPNEENENQEDQFLNVSERRLSIFDDEPPSIYDESSGIVRDQPRSATETDVSSFYPRATSSRRISEETLGFFSGTNLFSSKESQNVENLEGQLTQDETNKEILLSRKQSESTEDSKPRKTVTFGDDIEVFGSRLEEKSSEGDDNVFDGFQEEIKEEKASPGKLKHNLNINVQALLPGNVKPQRISNPDVNYMDFRPNSMGTPRLSAESSKLEENEEVEVLQSITKRRVKVPNRRPSTRRGREAFRKSHIEFLDEDKKEEKIPNESFVKSDDFANPEFNKPDLFENDNEDDLFSEKKLPPKSNILKRNLFDDDDDELDFFQNVSKKTISTSSNESSKSTIITKSLPATIKKLENVQVTEDDPLNAFER